MVQKSELVSTEVVKKYTRKVETVQTINVIDFPKAIFKVWTNTGDIWRQFLHIRYNANYVSYRSIVWEISNRVREIIDEDDPINETRKSRAHEISLYIKTTPFILLDVIEDEQWIHVVIHKRNVELVNEYQSYAQ